MKICSQKTVNFYWSKIFIIYAFVKESVDPSYIRACVAKKKKKNNNNNH